VRIYDCRVLGCRMLGCYNSPCRVGHQTRGGVTRQTAAIGQRDAQHLVQQHLHTHTHTHTVFLVLLVQPRVMEGWRRPTLTTCNSVSVPDAWPGAAGCSSAAVRVSGASGAAGRPGEALPARPPRPWRAGNPLINNNNNNKTTTWSVSQAPGPLFKKSCR